MHFVALRSPSILCCAPIAGGENEVSGSFVAFVRQMRLPVGIDLLTLLLKVSVGREFIMADLWSCIHGILGSVEHEQIRVRARLEVFPGNREASIVLTWDILLRRRKCAC